MRSRIPGVGEFYVCEDMFDVPENPPGVVYVRDELERMRGLPVADIQAIHGLKREWGGWYTEYVPPEQPMLALVPVSYPGGWGDEVRTPKGEGTVVAVWDNDHTASHVTVQLDAGGQVVFAAAEVAPCVV